MSDKPNIIYIVLDQWRGDCLSCYQNHHPIMTPHFDQLADEGTLFQQAYADCPICMPQRATMLTGMTASQFGMPHNFSPTTRTPIDPALSLPRRLTREADYQTKAIGKMHFVPERARHGFEHIALHPNDYVNFLEDSGYGGMYRGHGLGGNEVFPAVYPTPERFTHNHWIVEEGIRFLGQRDPDNPFFLWMVFEAPHSPFDPPQPYDRMYDNFTIPEPVVGDWTDEMPPTLQAWRIERKWDRLKPEVVRESRRRYYGLVSHIDYQLGRLLGELKMKGLYDNTVIVVTSDHGEHLGDHGLFSKYTFLQASARVPLIIRYPERLQSAVIDSAPVLTADITPTLLDIAGLDANPGVDGRSLIPRQETLEDRIICGETRHSVFATDGHYKYIHHLNGDIDLLFDVQNDPDDQHNLAENAIHTADMTRLRTHLINYMTQRERPVVEDGHFVKVEEPVDEQAVRSRNPYAWRGPLRYGQGYEG